jgi:mannose-6-phosphate isomerase-like protein (cupin superfamily)
MKTKVYVDRVKKDWSRRGYGCDVWTDPPGQVWEDYVHGTDELLMVLEGALELTVDGRTCRPAVGEEVFIPARATHTVKNVGGTASRWLYGYKRAR